MPKCLSNDIIKIATKFIKATIKVKRIRNYVLKFHLYMYFTASQKLLISAWFKGCVPWFIYFSNPFKVRYNCSSFHHCRICVTNFRDGAFLSPHPWAAPKMPILNRVNATFPSKSLIFDENAVSLSPTLMKNGPHYRYFSNIFSNVLRNYFDVQGNCNNAYLATNFLITASEHFYLFLAWLNLQ